MPPLRTVLAFLIAPVSFGLLLLVISLASPSMGIGIWALGFVAMIAYPLAFVVGIPLFWVLRGRRLTGVATYSVIALGFSAVLVSYFVIWPVVSQGEGIAAILLPARLGQIAIMLFASFFTIFVFWLIARPDKQVQSQN